MKDLLNILKHLIVSFMSIFIYFPVLGGILGAMIVAASAAQSFVYYFWDMLSLFMSLIPYSPIRSVFFFQGFFDIPSSLVPFLIISGYIFLLVGGIIFILGVLELGKGLVNKQNLVDQGIYRIIRHPQNFGIILFTLGIMLLVPLTWTGGYTIRIGDLFSWILFSLIWLIEGKWEEERKIKALNDDYLKYQEEKPFMLPFGKILEQKISRWVNPNWTLKKRILYWASIYFCFLIISSAVLPVYHTL